MKKRIKLINVLLEIGKDGYDKITVGDVGGYGSSSLDNTLANMLNEYKGLANIIVEIEELPTNIREVEEELKWQD